VLKIVLDEMRNVTLDVRKKTMLVAMNHLCMRLYMFAIMGIIAASGDDLKQVKYGERLLDLLQSHEDFFNQVSNATKAEQLCPIGVRFTDRYIDIQSQFLK